jgi:hypothetical protein
VGAVGEKTWVIAEGFLPPRGAPRGRALESHEAACVLNAGDSEAHLRIVIFFPDREPAGPYHVAVPARRTLHLRFARIPVDPLHAPGPLLARRHRELRPAPEGVTVGSRRCRALHLAEAIRLAQEEERPRYVERWARRRTPRPPGVDRAARAVLTAVLAAGASLVIRRAWRAATRSGR